MAGKANPVASPSPTVHRARVEDAPAVRALLSQVGVQFAEDSETFNAAYAAVLEHHEDHLLFVAERDGAVVGYALATVARLFYTNGDTAQIHELVVDESSRSHGVGSQLVSAVEDECRERGVRELTVATLRSATFYERLDYRSTANFLKKRFDE